MADERNLDPQMDAAALYKEEMFTDRNVGAIRRLTPVTGDGAADATRPVLFVGQAEIMTNMGPVPINFEIEGKSLADAVAGFSAAAAVGDRTHCAADSGNASASCITARRASGRHTHLGGGPGRGGGKIQMP